MLNHEGLYADFFAETKKPGASFCRVWRIILQTGDIIRVCDHDRDLTVSGPIGLSPSADETFLSLPGFGPTALRSVVSAAVDTISAEGITSGSITEYDLARALFDRAEVRAGITCWTNPTVGVWWNARLHTGPLTLKGVNFAVEWRKLSDWMTRRNGRAYLAECDVREFGDARCGLDLAALGYVHTGTIASVPAASETTRRVYGVSVSQADGYFAFGTVEFTSGLNDGWTAEIVGHASDAISLIQRPPYPVEIGNGVTLKRGCPRTWTACEETYDNLVNYRGFGSRIVESAAQPGVFYPSRTDRSTAARTLYFMPPDEILNETPDPK